MFKFSGIWTVLWTEGFWHEKLCAASNRAIISLAFGLLELLSRMNDRRNRPHPDHFFCLFFFLYNYRPKLAELIQKEGKQFPLALRIEIETLLDTRRVLHEEILQTEKEMRKLQERQDDAANAGHLAKSMFAKGAELPQVVKELERKYPYELNSQKPLSELFSELPADIGPLGN